MVNQAKPAQNEKKLIFIGSTQLIPHITYRIKMILTTCASCAVALPPLAKQCSRCKTRYCGQACQALHWKAGHKDLCKKIKKGGGAEQYNADKKYKEAVAVAVEACADDTKGQTCYICTEAVHWKTKEGLVRGCACRGTAGVAHVSCLAEQAKILVAEGEENNLIGTERFNARWARWYVCGLCDKDYHGVVRCALGWACWKAYVGRPEANTVRRISMAQLGNGLYSAGHHVDALPVREAELSMERRVGAPEETILAVQNNLANTYQEQGRLEQAIGIKREIYSGYLKLHGEENRITILSAYNYANSLACLERFEEAKSLLRNTIPVARRVLGEDDEVTLTIRGDYATALSFATGATLGDLRKSAETLQETDKTARRVLGPAHPRSVRIGDILRTVKEFLAARVADDSSSEDAIAAP